MQFCMVKPVRLVSGSLSYTFVITSYSIHYTKLYDESVESITIDDLKSFYEINISPSVTNLLVVGDIEKKRVEDAFADLFSQWMPHDVNMPVLVYPP